MSLSYKPPHNRDLQYNKKRSNIFISIEIGIFCSFLKYKASQFIAMSRYSTDMREREFYYLILINFPHALALTPSIFQNRLLISFRFCLDLLSVCIYNIELVTNCKLQGFDLSFISTHVDHLVVSKIDINSNCTTNH